MQSKYIIQTRTVPHRFKPITKSGIIAWEEGCLKCAVCVKSQCIYGVYDNRDLDIIQMIDSIDNQCMNCFSCVQNCPKELIHKSINPEFTAMGDSHWSPDIISASWNQAKTGKIPVSGAGYSGPFSGKGFDSMWTDMSEIVRPTRDGIHGREYISTAVDIGRAPKNLNFKDDGKMEGEYPDMIDIPLPIIIRVPSFGSLSEKTIKGWAMAASRLGTFLALPFDKVDEKIEDFHGHIMPVISSATIPEKRDEKIRMVEIPWDKDFKSTKRTVNKFYPTALVCVRLPMEYGVEERLVSLVDSGCPVINLEGGLNGRSMDDESIFAMDMISSAHLSLVNKGMRDNVTLFASGGFAMAEHVAKAILCGADAVFVDFPVLIALECRMCRRCEKGLKCPVEIDMASSKWVASRTINMLGSWHNQLLEVMGAMGIRDIRRLRGEAGRAIFFEEMDRETFGGLSDVEEGYELE
jgi:ferredoxin